MFTDAEPVDLVTAQFLRAADERDFEITAYCFRPDHSHLLIQGLADDADCKAFIKAAKQYSGYYYKQQYRRQPWQRYGFERVVRDDAERVFAVGYIVANPVRAGFVTHPSEYPHIGSQRYTLDEMLKMCEYSRRCVEYKRRPHPSA